MTLNKGVAKNVILYLGDGMSIPTITAARILKGQLQGHTGEETKLSFEEFPIAGLSKVLYLIKKNPTISIKVTVVRNARLA
jgi:alkaline phosphatase